jgi:hypothetical protein
VISPAASRLLRTVFSSAALLAEGLEDFSVAAGQVRVNFGSESNDYGRGFLAGSLSARHQQ